MKVRCLFDVARHVGPDEGTSSRALRRGEHEPVEADVITALRFTAGSARASGPSPRSWS